MLYVMYCHLLSLYAPATYCTVMLLLKLEDMMLIHAQFVCVMCVLVEGKFTWQSTSLRAQMTNMHDYNYAK